MLSNALRASHESGLGASSVVVRVQQTGKLLTLHVQDGGRGIPLEEQPLIWSPPRGGLGAPPGTLRACASCALLHVRPPRS